MKWNKMGADWLSRGGYMVCCAAMMVCTLQPVRAGEVAPAMINFQGVLTQDGKALTGEQHVQFRIFDRPAAGKYLWGRQFPVYCNDDGQFNVLLSDAGKNIAQTDTRLEDVFQGGGDRLFELQLLGSAQAIQPRQQIVSAPFAFAAEHAASASASSGDFTVRDTLLFQSPTDEEDVVDIELGTNAVGNACLSVADGAVEISDDGIRFNKDVYFGSTVRLFGNPEQWGMGVVQKDYDDKHTWDIEQDGFVLFFNKAGIKVKVTDELGDTIIELDHDEDIGSVLIPVRMSNKVMIADCDYGLWWFPIGEAVQ